MKEFDDFPWDHYTNVFYSKQVKEQIKNDGVSFLIKESTVKNGKVIFKDVLHPNWKEIYRQVIELNVKSVFECGCGSGHHLQNLKKLNPDLQVAGGELLQSQIDFGKNVLKIDPDISNKIKVMDLSSTPPLFVFDTWLQNKHEFVYTQAVVMHLHHQKALNFVRNMSKLSSNYMFLVENKGNHNFPQLFKESGILEEFELVADGIGMLLRRKNAKS